MSSKPYFQKSISSTLSRAITLTLVLSFGLIGILAPVPAMAADNTDTGIRIAGPNQPDASPVYADPDGNCGGTPCYSNLAEAITNTDVSGILHVEAGTYTTGIDVNKGITVSIDGHVTLNGGFTQSAGTVDLNGYTLTISGNFTRGDTIFTADNGKVILGGSGPQTLGGTTSTTFYDLEINNSSTGIAVVLGVDTIVNNTLTLTDGLLDLDDYNLDLGASANAIGGSPSANNMVVTSGTGALRKYYNATGSYTFPVGDNSGTAEYSPATLNFITSLGGEGYVGVKVTNAQRSGNNGLPQLSRYWTLAKEVGITSFTCNGTFYYTQDDVDDVPVSEGGPYEGTLLYAYKIDGTSFVRGSQADATNNILTFNSMTSFSDLTGGNRDNPTTATLASSQAHPAPAAVQVAWETASELEVIGFNVYRAETLDGARTLLNPALLAAHHPGDVDGSSYSYLDITAQPGRTYYYWVEVIAASGSILSMPMQAAVWYALYLPTIQQ